MPRDLRARLRRAPAYACVLLAAVLLGLGLVDALPPRALPFAGAAVGGLALSEVVVWMLLRSLRAGWERCGACAASQPDGLIAALGFCYRCGASAAQARPG
jgi:hypothetical protein